MSGKFNVEVNNSMAHQRYKTEVKILQNYGECTIESFKKI